MLITVHSNGLWEKKGVLTKSHKTIRKNVGTIYVEDTASFSRVACDIRSDFLLPGAVAGGGSVVVAQVLRLLTDRDLRL